MKINFLELSTSLIKMKECDVFYKAKPIKLFKPKQVKAFVPLKQLVEHSRNFVAIKDI